MALINIESALKKACQTLNKLPAGKGLEILSYKRNRGVYVIKEKEGCYYVRERGYENQKFWVEQPSLSSLLKSIMKREFPRSRKVRIYKLTSVEEAKKTKKIL